MCQRQWLCGKETDPENMLTNEAMIVGFSNLQKIQSTWNIGTRCKSVADLWESFILKVFVFFENAPSEWRGNQGVHIFSTLQKRLNADFHNITALVEKLGLKFSQNEFDKFSTNQLLEE